MSNLNLEATAIDFSLPATDGQTYSLDSFADKDVVAVFFTCNHCPYVLAWEDRLIALQAAYAAQGVQFVGICSNDPVKYPADNFEAMQAHAQQKGFNFPYLHDESQQIAHQYGAQRTPEFFVFDKERKLRYQGTVDDNYENPDAVTMTYLKDALDAALKGEAPATAETAPVGCTIKWRD